MDNSLGGLKIRRLREQNGGKKVSSWIRYVSRQSLLSNTSSLQMPITVHHIPTSMALKHVVIAVQQIIPMPIVRKGLSHRKAMFVGAVSNLGIISGIVL